MTEIASLAGTISEYGLYAIIACLVVAVIYLFRQVNVLHAQIQDILQNQNKAYSELVTRCVVAIESCNKVLDKLS